MPSIGGLFVADTSHLGFREEVNSLNLRISPIIISLLCHVNLCSVALRLNEWKYKVLGEQLFQQTGLRMLCGESVLHKYNMSNLLKYILFSVWARGRFHIIRGSFLLEEL